MKPVSKMIYDEMLEMNLLKVETVNERGKTTVVSKNFRVANEHKRSSAKTYYIEEPTYNYYLKIKENQSKGRKEIKFKTKD